MGTVFVAGGPQKSGAAHLPWPSSLASLTYGGLVNATGGRYTHLMEISWLYVPW